MTAPRHAPALDRRWVTTGLLAAVSLPLVAACDGGGDGDDDTVDLPGLPPLGDDPDEPLLAAALGAERAMLALVLDARRHRTLRPLLGATADVHTEHVRLLNEAASADDSSTAAPPGRRTSPRAILTALVRREQRLADAHVERAMAARSGPFARLLAVLAAAAAQQSVVLAEAGAGLRGDDGGGRS